MTTLTYQLTYTIIECSARGCGVTFALSDDFIKARRDDRQTWYCPNGHPRWYPGKTVEQEAKEAKAEAARKTREAARLADELASANTRALRNSQRADHEKRRAAAARGQVTKIRKRIAKGVCPCCNRYFPELHRHVAQEHPEYVLPEGVTIDA